MKKHPLIYVTSEYPPGPGGIGTHGLHLTRHLARRGFDVTVYAPIRTAFYDPFFDEASPFPIVRFGKEGERLRKYRHLYRLLKAHIRRASAPPVMVASGGISSWIVAGLKRKYPETAALTIAHGTDINPLSFLPRTLIRKALQTMDRVVAVSSYTAGRMPYLRPEKIVVINNGINAQELLRLAENAPSVAVKGAPALVTVGTVSERKGQMNVVRALPLIRQRFPRVHYHMIGIPRIQEAVMRLAEELQVADRITIHGPLPDREMIAILKGADIFMLLSQRTRTGDFEGFGIAVLEANILGKPAVGTRRSGIADAIKAGYSGRLVNPASPDEIAAAVTDIMNDYGSYAENARAWAQKFDWKFITDQYETVLRNLL